MFRLTSVIPAKAGIQIFCKGSKILDPGLRRDDEKKVSSTFYETINFGCCSLLTIYCLLLFLLLPTAYCLLLTS